MNSLVLTKEERDVLTLAAPYSNGQQLDNAQIGNSLGISFSRVKVLIYQSCIKLGAQNRNEAILFAIRKGEIKINDIYTIDELAEFYYRVIYPEVLTEIIHFVREGKNSGVNPENYEKIVCIERSKNTLLTKSEKYVLSLIGQGLPNIEIANKLCMSTSTIRTFLYRIYNKLGTHRRASAVILALIQGELKVSDVYSFNDLLNFLSPLGTETIEQISQLVYNKHSQRSLSD